jgi:hypothetical protein
MCGALTLIPLYAFMMWSGTNLLRTHLLILYLNWPGILYTRQLQLHSPHIVKELINRYNQVLLLFHVILYVVCTQFIYNLM